MSRRIFCALCGFDVPCKCPAQTLRTSPSRFARAATVYAAMLEQGVEPVAAMFKAARSVEGEPS